MNILKSSNCRKAADAITSRVVESLSKAIMQGGYALWLLSGGSAIEIECRIAKSLKYDQKQKIILGQVDERFVPIGSADHNWEQITKSGLEFAGFADVLPILQPGLGLEECRNNYQERLAKAFSVCDFSLGIYGIGTDGHTAGIKPMENKLAFQKFSQTKLVVSYSGIDYQRITTTATVINKLDEIDVYCCGEAKTNILNKLDTNTESYKMPAQLLKKGKNVVIFT